MTVVYCLLFLAVIFFIIVLSGKLYLDYYLGHSNLTPKNTAQIVYVLITQYDEEVTKGKTFEVNGVFASKDSAQNFMYWMKVHEDQLLQESSENFPRIINQEIQEIFVMN